MLSVDVSKIPPEGLDVGVDLRPGDIHVANEESFLLVGGNLQAHVERGDERSVHVRGHLDASLGLECGRCLEPFTFRLDQDVDLFYLPHRAEDERGGEDEVDLKLSDHDIVVGYYQGERLDLGETVREQLFLSLPMKRLCREDCSGLCPHCGANLNGGPCGCPRDAGDPRFEGLRKLLDKEPV